VHTQSKAPKLHKPHMLPSMSLATEDKEISSQQSSKPHMLTAKQHHVKAEAKVRQHSKAAEEHDDEFDMSSLLHPHVAAAHKTAHKKASRMSLLHPHVAAAHKKAADSLLKNLAPEPTNAAHAKVAHVAPQALKASPKPAVHHTRAGSLIAKLMHAPKHKNMKAQKMQTQPEHSPLPDASAASETLLETSAAGQRAQAGSNGLTLEGLLAATHQMEKPKTFTTGDTLSDLSSLLHAKKRTQKHSKGLLDHLMGGQQLLASQLGEEEEPEMPKPKAAGRKASDEKKAAKAIVEEKESPDLITSLLGEDSSQKNKVHHSALPKRVAAVKPKVVQAKKPAHKTHGETDMMASLPWNREKKAADTQEDEDEGAMASLPWNREAKKQQAKTKPAPVASLPKRTRRAVRPQHAAAVALKAPSLFASGHVSDEGEESDEEEPEPGKSSSVKEEEDAEGSSEFNALFSETSKQSKKVHRAAKAVKRHKQEQHYSAHMLRPSLSLATEDEEGSVHHSLKPHMRTAKQHHSVHMRRPSLSLTTENEEGSVQHSLKPHRSSHLLHARLSPLPTRSLKRHAKPHGARLAAPSLFQRHTAAKKAMHAALHAVSALSAPAVAPHLLRAPSLFHQGTAAVSKTKLAHPHKVVARMAAHKKASKKLSHRIVDIHGLPMRQKAVAGKPKEEAHRQAIPTERNPAKAFLEFGQTNENRQAASGLLDRMMGGHGQKKKNLLASSFLAHGDSIDLLAHEVGGHSVDHAKSLLDNMMGD